jgi:hypothetical protein
MDMEKEVIWGILENMDTNLHDESHYANEIYKLHIQDQIKLLNELNQIAIRRDYNGVAYFNLLYSKIEELQKKITSE